MAEKPIPKMTEIETLVVTAKCRVREVNKETAERKVPGDKIEIRGLEKLELLHRSLATRDLDWKPKGSSKSAVKEPVKP